MSGESAAAATEAALERAGLAVGRLDARLRGHPLLAAWSWRARLDAVARQSAADGQGIDPWRLAAVAAGVRLRLPTEVTLAERGQAFDAARAALALWGWHAAPDRAQRRAIAAAAASLPAAAAAPLLISAARALHAWLEEDRERAPMRAALGQWWARRQLLPTPAPLLTGARALHAGVPWALDAWTPRWLAAVAEEAESGLALLRALESGWRRARAAVAGRRQDCHAAAAVDVLAAAPLLSASGLARALAVSVRTATSRLDELAALGVAVEVSHRRKRRLWGLAGLAPLRDETVAPRRPLPGRRRGRPRRDAERAGEVGIEPVEELRRGRAPPRPPLLADEPAPELDRWLLDAERAIARTKALLDAVARGGAPPPAEDDEAEEEEADRDGERDGEGTAEAAADDDEWPPR